MFGFLIGTACLIGLIATVRRGFHGGCGRYGYAGYGGGCGHHGFHGHHHHRRGCEGDQEERGWGRDERGSWGGGHRERRGFPPFRGGFRGWGPRAWMSMLSERLDLTPAQEKVLFQSFEEVRDTMRKQRGELSETRKDVARAFRAPSFDAVLLGDVFGRHDSKMDEVRKAVVGALARLHEALDERQREKLAQILEEGWW